MRIQAKGSLLLFVAGLMITNATKHLQISLRHQQEKSNEEASKCIKALAKRYLKDAYDITILSDEPMDWIFQIFGNFVKVLANSKQSEPANFLELRKNVLVILQGENLEEDLAILKNLKKFYPRASHLIHVTNSEFDGRSWSDYLKNVAEYLTSINRTAIIIVNDAKKVRLYGYTNHNPDNCGRMSVVNYGYCESEVTLKKLFPKRPNLNGCEIKLRMTIVPPFTELYVEDGKVKAKGLESRLIILIMKKLNATIRILRDPNSTLTVESATSSNPLKDMIGRAEADVGIGYFSQRHSELAVYTRSYIFEYTSIIMPNSGECSLWINIVLPFQWQVWTFLISTVILAVILTMSVSILHREFPIIHIIRGFSGTGLSKKPRRTSRKIYFLSWSIFGYIIMQSYLASLTGLLTKPNQPLEFQTLTQLEKSNYPMGGILTFREHLLETNPGLYERYEIMNIGTYFDVLQEVIAGRKKLAVHADQTHIRMAMCGKRTKHHVIPELLEFHPTAALMPNTSVILAASDKIIIHILEAGLLQFWQTLVERQARVKCASSHVAMNAKNSSEELAEHAKISLIHLSGILLIFAIATSLSFLTFLCELFVAADGKKIGAIVELKWKLNKNERN